MSISTSTQHSFDFVHDSSPSLTESIGLVYLTRLLVDGKWLRRLLSKPFADFAADSSQQHADMAIHKSFFVRLGYTLLLSRVKARQG
jgi:hypothetical protein